MDAEEQDLQDRGERVQKIIVDRYTHREAGLTLTLRQMALYLLNEDDFGIDPSQFDPEIHEHAIPKYEMARIYLLVCAVTQDSLGFCPEDRDDPVYAIYEKAYQRSRQHEEDSSLRAKLDKIAAACGFHRPLPENA
jgi:hypothetical protein